MTTIIFRFSKFKSSIREIEKLYLIVNKKSNIFSMNNWVVFLGYVFNLHNGKMIIRYNNHLLVE